MTQPEDIKCWIENGLPGAIVEIEGDGQHFTALIVHADFAGKSRIARHQMVYQALGGIGGKMHSQIHALSMRALTPQQYEDMRCNHRT